MLQLEWWSRKRDPEEQAGPYVDHELYNMSEVVPRLLAVCESHPQGRYGVLLCIPHDDAYLRLDDLDRARCVAEEKVIECLKRLPEVDQLHGGVIRVLPRDWAPSRNKSYCEAEYESFTCTKQKGHGGHIHAAHGCDPIGIREQPFVVWSDKVVWSKWNYDDLPADFRDLRRAVLVA